MTAHGALIRFGGIACRTMGRTTFAPRTVFLTLVFVPAQFFGLLLGTGTVGRTDGTVFFTAITLKLKYHEVFYFVLAKNY